MCAVMEENSSVVEKVVKEINDEFGSDVEKLSKCHEIYKRLQEEKESIEKLLSMASSAAPSRVNAAVRSVEAVATEVSEVAATYDELSVQVQTHLASIAPVAAQLQAQTEKVVSLEQCLSYLLWIQKIEALSNQLESAYQSKNERRTVILLSEMSEERNKLKNSACSHLVSFITETLHFWQGLIKDKLSHEFEEVLKVLKWPFVGGSQVLAAPPSSDTLQRFEHLVELLLKLELPEMMGDTSEASMTSSALLVDFAPPPLPLQLMVSPLRKRFLYHFSGNRQTNRLDKPEWYMAQVLAWVRDHSQFVTQRVQPVLTRIAGPGHEASVEFSRALVQLVLEKLHADLPALQQDDALFAHALDETLAFDRELRAEHSYPSAQPGVVSVITQAPLFQKWIAMERKYAIERMDRMLSSDSAWQPMSQDSGQDELKITECAEGMLNLLLTMTNRYRSLPQPGHRVHQLFHSEKDDPLHSRLPAMLNTVSYIAAVLREWNELPHFLQLQFYREQLEGRREGGDEGVQGCVFDEPLDLIDRLVTKLLDCVLEATLLDVKARSREYRKDKWFSMPMNEERSLTPSACGMFRVLSARLLELQDLLSEKLFTRTWQSLAGQLSQFIHEEVVMENWFSEGGAKQLQYDMMHGVFPLFGQYTTRPDSYFIELKESCILLTLTAGTAKLVVASLHQNDPDILKVLDDIGVQRLEPDQAMNVLARRNDISADQHISFD
ncbi:hypothetical protein B566_EDAN009982 [Ephemera danica]|nr:hypothetical protein B566_EDAN009982 [Ephemera danica]